MRTAIIVLAAALQGCAIAGALAAEPEFPFKLEHPGVVALVQGGNGYQYIHAETGARLYISDRDSPGKSVCNEGCALAWIPLRVTEGEDKGFGDWTIISRTDGTKQWAYKERPVYTLYHDSVASPLGDGAEGNWHLLVP